MEQIAWVTEKAKTKRDSIGNWVESLSENDTRLLELLCEEIRERTINQVMQEVEKSKLIKSINKINNNWFLNLFN